MTTFYRTLFSLMVCFSCYAQDITSYGVYAGLNFPLTIDKGLKNDPRFYGKFTLRPGTPVGFSYGYDKRKYGILLTPGYLQIGQQFSVKNYLGGLVGTRDVQMHYFSVPIAFKLYLNDLVFFRLSVLAALNFSYLIKGQEVLNISSVPSARELNYPPGVSVPNSPGYTPVYNGVLVPNVSKEVYVSNDKFAAFQIFAGLGFHSDFDFSKMWSINFDGRANYGILDPRSSSYISILKNPSPSTPDAFGKPGAPDLYGQRNDVYLSASIGISRIIGTKEKFRTKTSGVRKKLILKKAKKGEYIQ